MENRIEELKLEFSDTLQNNILSYWASKLKDDKNGGFYGQITGHEELIREADRGAILNTRMLWTYAAAYRLLGKPEYLDAAVRAKEYLLNYFYDKDFGGIYWSVNYVGEPVDTKKQIYALGFAIYGLSEFHRATGDKEALEFAIAIFRSIEAHSFDPVKGGYYEALTREWHEIADMRLSAKDANECKTMNTHLHILEPYTNLYRVWKDESLKQQLRGLIRIFLDKILDKETYHLNLFFDNDWNNKHEIVSYGHDIEASWLLHEAALVLGDADLLQEVEAVVPLIAKAAAEGLQSDGSMIYELDKADGRLDADRHWWVQAETVVGYLNLYQYFHDKDALDKVVRCWDYIKLRFIDKENGEWFWSIKADGTTDLVNDKAGFWKCPYHNSRMCMELIERFRD